MLVILDFRFRQRCLVLDAPVNRPRAFVDVTTFDETREHACGLGFVVVRHSEVRIVPLAENAEALEIARLALQRVLSVLAADAAKSFDTQVALLFALLLECPFDVLLDRQSVAVVTRNVRARRSPSSCVI